MSKEEILARGGFVVLGKSGQANAFQGIVEHSWSMGLSADRACFFWNTAKDPAYGRRGAEHYQKHFNETRPDMQFTVYAIDDPALPVKLEWDEWWKDNKHVPNTFSGVANKFKARNVRFEML